MFGTAPWVDITLNWIKNNPSVTNPEIHRLKMEIFRAMGHIEPVSEDEIRHIWIEIPRGTIDDYGDLDEYIEEGIVENQEEFVRNWRDLYPDESKWYEIVTIQYLGEKYIFIDNELVFKFKDMMDSINESENDENSIAFLRWILGTISVPNNPKWQEDEISDRFLVEISSHHWQMTELGTAVIWDLLSPDPVRFN